MLPTPIDDDCRAFPRTSGRSRSRRPRTCTGLRGLQDEALDLMPEAVHRASPTTTRPKSWNSVAGGRSDGAPADLARLFRFLRYSRR